MILQGFFPQEIFGRGWSEVDALVARDSGFTSTTRVGRREWQMVENTMYRYKTLIGRRDAESNLRWTTS